MRASWDVINLADDDVPPANRPNQLKMRLHTHSDADFVPSACCQSDERIKYKGHEIRYERLPVYYDKLYLRIIDGFG